MILDKANHGDTLHREPLADVGPKVLQDIGKLRAVGPAEEPTELAKVPTSWGRPIGNG